MGPDPKDHGINVLSLNTPIELHLQQNVEIPHKIIGWFSTALFTLQKIYPEIEVTFKFIDTYVCTEIRQREIKSVYDHAKALGYIVEDQEFLF